MELWNNGMLVFKGNSLFKNILNIPVKILQAVAQTQFAIQQKGGDAFSEVPGGRPSSFHGVTEWGTPWLRSEGAENSGGGRIHPSVTL